MEALLSTGAAVEVVVGYCTLGTVHGVLGSLNWEWLCAVEMHPLRALEAELEAMGESSRVERVRTLGSIEDRLHRLPAMRDAVARGKRWRPKAAETVLEERAPACEPDVRRVVFKLAGWTESLAVAHRAPRDEYHLGTGRWTSTSRALVAATRDASLAARLGLTGGVATVWDSGDSVVTYPVDACTHYEGSTTSPKKVERFFDGLERELANRGCGSVSDLLDVALGFSEGQLIDRNARLVYPEGTDDGKKNIQRNLDEYQLFQDEYEAALGDAAARAARPVYAAVLASSTASQRTRLIRAAVLLVQKKRSAELRPRVAALLDGLDRVRQRPPLMSLQWPPAPYISNRDDAYFFRPFLARLWPLVSLPAPARTEQLWRGSGLEVVFELKGSDDDSPLKMALVVRRESDLDTGDLVVSTVLASAVPDSSSQRGRGFVLAGPPDDKAYYRPLYRARRVWAKRDPKAAADSLEVAWCEGCDDSRLRHLLRLPVSVDTLAVLQLLRTALLSFVLDYACTLDPTNRHDGLVVNCLPKFALASW